MCEPAPTPFVRCSGARCLVSLAGARSARCLVGCLAGALRALCNLVPTREGGRGGDGDGHASLSARRRCASSSTTGRAIRTPSPPPNRRARQISCSQKPALPPLTHALLPHPRHVPRVPRSRRKPRRAAFCRLAVPPQTAVRRLRISHACQPCCGQGCGARAEECNPGARLGRSAQG